MDAVGTTTWVVQQVEGFILGVGKRLEASRLVIAMITADSGSASVFTGSFILPACPLPCLPQPGLTSFILIHSHTPTPVPNSDSPQA